MRSFQVCTCGQPLQCNEYPDAEARPAPRCCSRCWPPASATATCICPTAISISAAASGMSLHDRGMKLPVTLGHENVGEVVAVGPQARGRQGRRPPARASLDRLRHLRGLPARRRKSLPRHEEPRRVLERRLFRSSDGAASALSDRHRRSAAGARRAARLLGRHHLRRAEEGRPDADDRADRDHRRRRAWPDVPRHCTRRWAARAPSSSTSIRRSARRRRRPAPSS